MEDPAPAADREEAQRRDGQSHQAGDATDLPQPPRGWWAQRDEASGGMYYWNAAGDVQWQMPTSPAQLPGEPPETSSARAPAAGTEDTKQHPSADTCESVCESTEASSVSHAGSSAAAAPALSLSEWMKLHEVKLSPGCPSPVRTFEAAGLPRDLLAEIAAAGFSAPSPIQAASWAVAMARRDVIGLAQTGSGKTLAFLAPAFARIAESASGLIVPVLSTLVLAPTRELATQIAAECARFGRTLGVSACCLYGGAPRAAQLAEVEAGVHVAIATPGRLLDFLETGQVRLDDVTYVVLDEADRMLDLGFEPQVAHGAARRTQHGARSAAHAAQRTQCGARSTAHAARRTQRTRRTQRSARTHAARKGRSPHHSPRQLSTADGMGWPAVLLIGQPAPSPKPHVYVRACVCARRCARS